jgi:hypothetical protein
LEISNEIFSRFGNYMGDKIKLRVWKELAKTLIENYLFSLFVSQGDEEVLKEIKKFEINDLRKKLKYDKILIRNFYKEKIGEENINEIITGMDSILEFLESSSDMISLSCKSLIEYSGNSFNLEYAKVLINLRRDFDSEEKKGALESCKEVIDNFKDDSSDKATRNLFEYVNQIIQIKKNNRKSVAKKIVKKKTVEKVDEKYDLADFGIDLSDEEDDVEEEENNEQEKTENVNFFVPTAINYSVNVDIIMEDTMQKKSYDM